MVKYSLDFKMNIVSEYLSGSIGLDSLAKKYGFKSNGQLRKWINAYQTLGIEGLKRSRKNKTYSVDFKLKAINMYESSEKSYQEITNELGLKNPSLVTRWHKEYLKHGIDGLSRKKGLRSPRQKKNCPN